MMWLCFGFVLVSGAMAMAPACPAMHDKEIKLCIAPTIQAAEQIGVQLRHAPAAIPRLGKKVFLELCGLVFLAAIPRFGKKVFLELCGHLEEMESCLGKRRLREVCPGHASIKVMDSSYGYLCNDGRQDCLLELDTNPRTEKCHSEAMHRINRIHKAPEDDQRRQHDMCDALDSFATCVRDSVIDRCGREAWALILRVLRDTTETLMPNCRLGPHDPPPTPRPVYREDVISYHEASYAKPSVRKAANSLAAPFLSLLISGLAFLAIVDLIDVYM